MVGGDVEAGGIRQEVRAARRHAEYCLSDIGPIVWTAAVQPPELRKNGDTGRDRVVVPHEPPPCVVPKIAARGPSRALVGIRSDEGLPRRVEALSPAVCF